MSDNIAEYETQDALRRNEADHPSSPVMRFMADQALPLDAGVALAPWQIAYQTYGELNADKSNAVLICHALTGDQHVASVNPVTGKPRPRRDNSCSERNLSRERAIATDSLSGKTPIISNWRNTAQP